MSSEAWVNKLQHPINDVFNSILWLDNRPSGKILLPAVQLASLMLESSASKRFIHSLFETNSHHSLGSNERKVFCHFRRSTACDKVIEDTVAVTLKKLSKIITFGFYEVIPDAPHDELGLTTVDRDGETIHRCHTAIQIDGFKRALKEDITPAELDREIFVLATTLAHEIIHAIDGTLPEKCNHSSEIPIDHFYEGHTECEIGFAWEMEVFGAIRIGCERMGDPAMLHALPSLEQNQDELVFDGEQHMIYVHPLESVVDYESRLQRREFWTSTPRTSAMLKISTKPEEPSSKPTGSMSEVEPLDVLKARGKRDKELALLLKRLPRRKATQKRYNEL